MEALVKNLKLILLIFLFISCSSSIQISSSKKIPVSFDEMDKHTKLSKVTIKRDFFLWGLVPGKHEVDLAKELKNKGFDSLAEVKVYEESSSHDRIWSIVTLGFWWPKTIVIEGKKIVK